MKLMEFGINNIKMLYKRAIKKLYEKAFGDTVVLNINRDFLNPNQKTVLLCYTVEMFNITFEKTVYHANMYHSIQMIKVLIEHGYAIDICKAKSIFDSRKLKRNYAYIIGFGPLYKQIIDEGIKGKRILLLTENDPFFVKEKYNQRIQYFIERHGKSRLRHNLRRDTFYTLEQIELSDICIAMSSDYNLARISSMMKTYKVHVNALVNYKFIYETKDIPEIRNNFVWFGSAGFIHKGLDILVDVFSQLPQFTLSIYGLNQSERPIVEQYITDNIKICGSVDVLSDRFISEVINRNTFVISASCSEGMNTGVATCMMHGLIPVMTKETGFDNPGFFIELDDFSVESIKQTLLEIEKISDEALSQKGLSVYNYSIETFSLNNFTQEFNSIITEIEELDENI